MAFDNFFRRGRNLLFIEVLNTTNSRAGVIGYFYDNNDPTVRMTETNVISYKEIGVNHYVRFDRDVMLQMAIKADKIIDRTGKVKRIQRENTATSSRQELVLPEVTEVYGSGVLFGAGTIVPPLKKLILPKITSITSPLANYVSGNPASQLPLELVDFRSWLGNNNGDVWDAYSTGSTDWCTDFTKLVVKAHINCKTTGTGGLPQKWVKEVMDKGGTVMWHNADGTYNSTN